ncbi:MAG: DUF1295 domain-containing protein [Acidobacteriota bacterium]
MTIIVWSWLTVAVMMAVLWLVQKATDDAGIVDVGWSAGLGVIAVLAAFLLDADPSRRLLVALLAGVWSLRLAGYLLVNRVLGRPEDGRYRTLRARWGAAAQRNFFVFFQAQAALDVVFALPFLFAMANPRPLLGVVDLLGIGVWTVAVVGEAMADAQLARFRSDPTNRGRTCRRGLWRVSRHPNYFFEWLHWWAYVALAFPGPGWWVALLGPALMLLFLFKVTGIPATEAQALASRGEEYRDYQRTTSVFVPWFPARTADRERSKESGGPRRRPDRPA